MSHLVELRYCRAAVFLMLFAALIHCLAVIAVPQTKIDYPGPVGSGAFGTWIEVLANGNIMISDPYYDDGAIQDVGAVHLIDGATNTIISTMKGTQADDRVGAFEFEELSNGNFVVMSPYWSNGAATEAGAVTLCSGVTGCPATVTAANSLVGTSVNDQVGVGELLPLAGGRYVISSYNWNAFSGAVTFCEATGCTGPVTTTNSLHGIPEDMVGFYQLVLLPNGNYVVSSQWWGVFDNGAVTLCDGTTGCVGQVTSSNSLVGTMEFDGIGDAGIFALPNSKFIVSSPNWHNGTLFSFYGASTLCDGTTGCPSTITSSNSLIGGVNYFVGTQTAILDDGNYVVGSYRWNGSRGAVTWCNGTTGCTGVVSAANSLIGSAANNEISFGGITPLSGGRYIISSPNWDNGATANVGAVTYCATVGGCIGTVSTANSLHGTTANDNVGSLPIGVFSGSNDYVVNSPNWDKGAVVNVGASTRCLGATGCVGPVTAANSLTGSTANDNVGMGGALLSDGNHVVRSPNWDGAFANVGAATYCIGFSCMGSVVSSSNSFVGSQADDRISIGGIQPIPYGRYAILSPQYDDGSDTNAGAVTYTLAGGIIGTVADTNSVIGSGPNSGNGLYAIFDPVRWRLIVGRQADNLYTTFGLGPSSSSVRVIGRVLDGKRPVVNATLRMSDTAGRRFLARSNAFGYFTFDSVPSGSTYVLEVVAKSVTIAPVTLFVDDDVEGLEVNTSNGFK